jgi:RimJ/RimL family protein N-acetyltransferase
MNNGIEVVGNREAFYEFIRRLRNDERVQGGFLEQAAITPAQQVTYMAKHGDRFVVALLQGEPVGYAGSIDGDIRVCTDPACWGKGVGKALILALVEKFPGSHARIKPENKASVALFESCGFALVGRDGDLFLYRRPLGA